MNAMVNFGERAVDKFVTITLDSALRSLSGSLRLDKDTLQPPGILNGLQHLLNTCGEQCPLVFHLAFILTIPLSSPFRFLLLALSLRNPVSL